MNLIRWFYEPIQPSIHGVYDVVVPLDYGVLIGDDILPKATVAGIHKAITLLKTGRVARIAWATASHFGVPKEIVNKEKYSLLKASGVPSSTIGTMIDCTNSITEAEYLLEQLPQASRIIVICDWRHARRVKKIWHHFFNGELVVLTTNENWDEHHRSFWCRSNFRWLAANIIHHVLLLMKGVESLHGIVHSVKSPT